MSKLSELEDGSFVFQCPGCEQWHRVNHQWEVSSDLEKPTIKPSVFVNAGKSNRSAPVCHSFVTDGMIEFLTDSDHKLSGKTVALPEVE